MCHIFYFLKALIYYPGRKQVGKGKAESWPVAQTMKSGEAMHGGSCLSIISAWRMGLRQECYPECKGSFTYSMRPCLKKRRRREEEKKKEEEKSK